jgi:hypothetical protein
MLYKLLVLALAGYFIWITVNVLIAEFQSGPFSDVGSVVLMIILFVAVIAGLWVIN